MKKIIFIALLCLFWSSMILTEERKTCHSNNMNGEIEKTKQEQVICPVMGNKINKDIYTEYEGKKVYFCCKACINIFENSPEKYLNKMEESQTEKTEEIKQEKCPVMGNKINKDIYTEYEGKKVYFCCKACINIFENSPEKYLNKMEESQAEMTEEIAQEKCPVMGMDIDPDVFTEYKGKKIYFCCSSCIEKFKADPEKYLEELEEE